MPEPATKKKKGFFQKVAQLVKDLVEWVEETFSDPELSAEIRDDLGLDRDNPATPAPPDGARQGPHRGVRRQGGRRRGVVAGGGRRHQGRGRRDHRLHRGGQGRPGRRPGAVRDDVQAVRARPAAGAQPGRLRARAARRPRHSTTRSSSSSSTRRRCNSSCAARARRSTARRGCSACRCSAASRSSCGHRAGRARRASSTRLRLGSGSRGRRRGRGDRRRGR